MASEQSLETCSLGPNDFDRFIVADFNNGHASLDGTLNITLVDGFTPVLGNCLNIMSFESRTGTLATVNGTIGGDLFFAPLYTATRCLFSGHQPVAVESRTTPSPPTRISRASMPC